MEATMKLGTKTWLAIVLLTAACGVTPEARSGELGVVCATAAECAAECIDDACIADLTLGCTADDDCASDERCHAGTCVDLAGSPAPAADETDEPGR